jgi:hypothetical protein
MSRPRHSGVMDAPLRFVLPLLLLFSMALPACDGSTEPVVELPFNELTIHAAILERLAVFNHSIEANTNLGLALEHPMRHFEPLATELLGQTLIYNFDELEWQVDAQAPAPPANTLRVTWYPLSGSSVTSPEPRGYVDLTRQTDPTMERVQVAVVRTATSPGNLTDYFIRYGSTEVGGVETRTFEAEGSLSDGSRTVDLRHQEITSETATGDTTATHDLKISDSGISYTSVMDASITGALESVNLVMSVVLEGATTRVALDIQEVTGQVSSGTGEIHHNGVKVADVSIAGDQMTFATPSGGSFRSAQLTRLRNLVGAMFNPVLMAGVYFR